MGVKPDQAGATRFSGEIPRIKGSAGPGRREESPGDPGYQVVTLHPKKNAVPQRRRAAHQKGI